MNTDNEKAMIDKYEKDDLLNEDFAIKIYDGGINLSLDTETEISIYSYDKYSIKIEGKEHYIKNITLFNKIKKIISDNFDTLVLFSKMETKEFISKNMLLGCSRNIAIKYGQLLININGAINGNIGNFCKEFIEEIKKLIISEGEKTQEDYMMELLEKNKPQALTPLDEEFDKYCKLYESRFGKRAYIPEPGGTKEFAVECIKKCLDENKDMLDDLYYPNFKKDMENGVLYSETKNDLNSDEFKITDENLKNSIMEVIGNNDIYLNTQVYDIVKKIIDLPYENVTTIANLINYNPNEKFVEPIVQGQIKRLVKETCKRLNIELEENRDKIGGLAYYCEFVKLNNNTLDNSYNSNLKNDTGNSILYSEVKNNLSSNKFEDKNKIDL